MNIKNIDGFSTYKFADVFEVTADPKHMGKSKDGLIWQLVPNTRMMMSYEDGEAGYANGYVGVPKEHPLFGVDYSEIGGELNISTELTYSAEKRGYWVFGFDTIGDQWSDADYDECLKMVLELADALAAVETAPRQIED